MDETKKERFLRVLSKLEKTVVLKDPEGAEVEFKIGYPTWRNSDKFWDIIYSVMSLNKEVKEGEEPKFTNAESIELVKLISPKIIAYIVDYMENKSAEKYSDEEKEYYYIVLQSGLMDIVSIFLDMSTKMFGNTGDVPKNPLVEPKVSTTELKSE